jgi:NodT family efflux transporter outer membrane factor (OMF) lipoprotein
MQTLNLAQLRAATLSGGVLAITLRADGASFVVDVQTQSGQATMVTSRQQPRRFVDPRKALEVLRALGWNACQIDVGQWRPEERAGQAVRPDRSDALKAAHQAAHQAEHQAAQANALASQEDLALARLSAQATLVQTYIAMRNAERQQAVVEKAQAAYERALTLTRYRYDAGVVSAADVAQAESQWQSTVAQRIDVETTRQQLTHSLAVLLGQAPSALQMAASQALPALPALPTVLPASLLQRRPDIRAAEMRVMGAQAQLGVAQTAFFPTFSFAASTGYKSTELASLFNASSRLWSLGPSLALSLFDGGQRQAAKDDARAALEVALLNYQQTVLTLLQEVEDNLVATHQLQAQEAAQAQALQAAERNLRITEAQYAAGTVSYLNVVTAQASALAAQRNLLDVQSRRALAVTQLMKNLAGRWDTATASK